MTTFLKHADTYVPGAPISFHSAAMIFCKPLMARAFSSCAIGKISCTHTIMSAGIGARACARRRVAV